jgi:DNA-binding NtrC family response regulator
MSKVSDFHREYSKDKFKLKHKTVYHPAGLRTIKFEITLDAEGGNVLDQVTKILVILALEAFDRNMAAVSRCLGKSTRTLRYWIHKYKLYDHVSENSKAYREHHKRMMARNRPTH